MGTQCLLWSAEEPQLYVLVLQLRDARSGTVLEWEACQVGFRSACIRDKQLLHNNRPVMIKGAQRLERGRLFMSLIMRCPKLYFPCANARAEHPPFSANTHTSSPTLSGVNRHEHCPARGKVVSRAAMLRDARLAKQHNFNAIRCSHYPNRDDWFEICNFIGLYLVDEVNCETHGFDATLSKPWLNPTSHPAWAPCILGALLIEMWVEDCLSISGVRH